MFSMPLHADHNMAQTAAVTVGKQLYLSGLPPFHSSNIHFLKCITDDIKETEQMFSCQI